MKIIIFCIIAITLVFSTSFASSQYKCQGTALCITGKVTKIVDGDTIYLKDYKIRLSLTNTPEKGEIGFKQATSFTKTLCPLGSTITVDQDDKQPFDKYKRVVGKVTCSGKVLNSELLYNGLANILKQYCSKSEFSGEAWAQKYGCDSMKQETKQQTTKSQTPTPTPTTKDLDFDGIADSFDGCPTQPETVNGYKDSDGCPDEIPKESQTPAPTNENQRDPSYPDVCIPPYPPDLDCGDIPYKNFRVLSPDPHGFDRDNDGIGCEK